jgi:hypothetical protein
VAGVKHELEPRKRLAQHRQDASGVGEIVERRHRIIGDADKCAMPRKAWPYLCLDALIEHVVQEDVATRNTLERHSSFPTLIHCMPGRSSTRCCGT